MAGCADMRFGCCIGIDEIAAAEQAGCDYVELPVVTVCPESAEADFAPVRKRVLSCGIRPEAWNCLIPGTIKVTGPEADLYRIERFIKTAFQRIASLGGEIVVFGSGASRHVPEGFPLHIARRQILEFLAVCAEAGADCGITLAIEPLYRKASNMINSIPEAVEFAEVLDAPNVRVLADFYHIDEEGEPFSNIVSAGRRRLAHIHTADTDRRAPGTGNYDYDAFFRALKEIGYNARNSIECIWDDFDREIRCGLEFLRAKWQQVQVQD